MDIKNQIIQEYLSKGCGFRKLAAKYGISRTTICKWVAIHQGIHNLPRTEKQQTYSISSMNSSKKRLPDNSKARKQATKNCFAGKTIAMGKTPG